MLSASALERGVRSLSERAALSLSAFAALSLSALASLSLSALASLSLSALASLSLSALASLTLSCSAAGDGRPGLASFDPNLAWDSVANQPRGPRPHFSFFVTSQQGLFGLGAGMRSPAPDPSAGFGGDLGGLAGADEICSMLAQRSNPGDTKLWRAFLSSSGLYGSPRQDAIERVGAGPWYDFDGRTLALDIQGLLPAERREGRPQGADPQLALMFTSENGERARDRDNVDNHDILTGSDPEGRLYDDGQGGAIATCHDWTSKTLRGNPGGPMATGGQIPVGHSWPRSNAEGRHWISEHTVNGCEAGVDIDGGTAAARTDFRVGAAGGYGGFYCFALNAIPPSGSAAP